MSEVDREIDRLYDHVLELLEDFPSDENTSRVNDDLAIQDVTVYDTAYLLAILTITHLWTHNLPNREILFLRIQDHLNEKFGADKCGKLLRGLDEDI